MTDRARDGHANATPRLIVNADDLGQAAARDRGIFALHAVGAISSASLVVNAPQSAHAARQAVQDGLPIGLHLNLGEGKAITGRSSLTDANGQLPGKHGLRAGLSEGRIAGLDLKAEIDAQCDRFVTLTGQTPSHVDGHHHCHVAPAVALALADGMRRRGIRFLRLPKLSDDIESWSDVAQRFGDDAHQQSFHCQVQNEARMAEDIFCQHGLDFPDRFCGIALMGEAMSVDALRACLQRIASSPAAAVELMCHPGHRARSGSDFTRSPARQQEFSTLQSLLRRSANEAWPFGLIPGSFRDLPTQHPGEKPESCAP